jgi:hypothetical protein
MQEKWFNGKLSDAMSKVGKKRLKLKNGPRLTLITISNYADANGECWPLEKHIAEDSGQGETTVRGHIKLLKQRKFIQVKRKYDGERKMTRNYYKIQIDVILNISIDEKGEMKMEKEIKQECINIEPPAESAGDQPAAFVGGTHYISTTQKATTQKAKSQAFVQDEALDDMEMARLFDEFWAAYPRKEHKKEAFKVWRREKLSLKADEIISDVRIRQVKHDRWEDRAFIPLPGTYLNGEQWENEIIEMNHAYGKQNRQTSYIDQLNAAGNLITGSQSNVFEISGHLDRKVVKKY